MVLVKDIDYGIAFQVTDSKTGEKYIEMNRDLKEDPILYNAILGHELDHYNSSKWIDFWLDIKPKWYSCRLLKWSIRHPKSLYSLSPIFIEHGKKPSINFFMAIYWAILIGLSTLAVYLMKILYTGFR